LDNDHNGRRKNGQSQITIVDVIRRLKFDGKRLSSFNVLHLNDKFEPSPSFGFAKRMKIHPVKNAGMQTGF